MAIHSCGRPALLSGSPDCAGASAVTRAMAATQQRMESGRVTPAFAVPSRAGGRLTGRRLQFSLALLDTAALQEYPDAHLLDWLAGKLAESPQIGNARAGVKGAARELFGHYARHTQQSARLEEIA